MSGFEEIWPVILVMIVACVAIIIASQRARISHRICAVQIVGDFRKQTVVLERIALALEAIAKETQAKKNAEQKSRLSGQL